MNVSVVLAACEPGGYFIVDGDGNLPRLGPSPGVTAIHTALSLLRAACPFDPENWVVIVPVGFRDDPEGVDLIFAVAFPEPFPLAPGHAWRVVLDLDATQQDIARRAIHHRN